MKSEERKLIKFSNYSLCVTLPKQITKDLNWDKGDVVKMLVDSKKGEIVIKKVSTKNLSETKNAELKNKSNNTKSRW